MQLASYRERFTAGRLRRRAAKVARRAACANRESRIVTIATVSMPTHMRADILKTKQDEYVGVLRGAGFGWRTIRARLTAFTELQHAIAKAAGIRRCTFRHVTVHTDQKTGQRTEHTGAPCGGRLKRTSDYVETCRACGREYFNKALAPRRQAHAG